MLQTFMVFILVVPFAVLLTAIILLIGFGRGVIKDDQVLYKVVVVSGITLMLAMSIQYNLQ